MAEPARIDRDIYPGDDTPPLVWGVGPADAPEIPAGAAFRLDIAWSLPGWAVPPDTPASGAITAASPNGGLTVNYAAGTVAWAYTTVRHHPGQGNGNRPHRPRQDRPVPRRDRFLDRAQHQFRSTDPPGMTARRPLTAIGGDLAEVPAGDGLPNLPLATQSIVPVLGGTYALDGAAGVAILDPLLALGSVTLTLPTAPVEGQVQQVVTRYTITTLTVSASSGKSIVGAPTTITPTSPFALIYRAASSTWFRLN